MRDNHQTKLHRCVKEYDNNSAIKFKGTPFDRIL